MRSSATSCRDARCNGRRRRPARTLQGAGGWSEDPRTERFFRPGYAANLVASWIPAIDGLEAKLKKGASVADVGCGHGASTLIMAQAFPESTFVGFDYHEPSVRYARDAAAKAGVADRVRFEVASAKSFPGSNDDLVAVFDCLHDMATRSAPPRMSARRSPTTAPG